MELRPLRAEERDWLVERLRARWGTTTVVSRGIARDGALLPALVCSLDGELVGAATYAIEGEECELVSIETSRPGAGAGSALLDGVASAARASGCRRLLAVTTNDNLRALRFYQRRGLRLVALRPGAVEEARRTLKPEIPHRGEGGIPIRDELELELELD